MQILDTQVISYAFKGVYDGQVNQQLISSVTAKEFLLIQGSDRTAANYYVPLPRRMKNYSPEKDMAFPRMDHPFSKWNTDQIILDFGQDYPSIIEFSNYAITEVINLKAKNLFREATRFLNKDQKKLILRRFRFLLDSQVQCVPLSKSVLNQGIHLFYEFLSNYNVKSEIKNTINDVLILATAIDLSAVVITKDSLLNRFSSEYFDTVVQVHKEFITIDFGTRKGTNCSKSRESKEYINRGWKVRMLNSTGAW
ncbi:hypothetical protein I8748_30885 [Nostoc sp. CENA67]|uniref:PIN domain-containing protein n=1 Tax=Amazonocrinis nigriterrae CENA67 TaxID=2794033 RepID=A0A8J7HZY7_9NOST|nr:hypothetical protein [Amazonocrinis nigriterrae]MBH8566508.1 hypothetical protein [Amazonocrinis nigriterrae CENA67]